ncbi:MAG: nucleoside triphosphate pyrophosphohydrolase [Proteobacteria bacterium]|nr:nucleoside triphosphate pyrophosphohydrolase [Pseudomonadota bacterium]
MTHCELDSAAKAFAGLCGTIAALRDPTSGCPWDLAQTHETLRKYMLEEAYEAVEVMSPLKPSEFKEELGDVLLQVVLNSQIAADNKHFNITDVIQNLDSKMRRRHPHVFSDAISARISAADVSDQWEKIKSREKSQPVLGVFDSVQPGKLTPSLIASVAIGKIAKKINFDWPSAQDVLAQFKSEVEELSSEILEDSFDFTEKKTRVYEEMGDVLFSLGQLCRHLEIDPEVCGLDGNQKFLRRFKKLEELAASEGTHAAGASTEVLERLWQAAKLDEKKATIIMATQKTD